MNNFFFGPPVDVKSVRFGGNLLWSSLVSSGAVQFNSAVAMKKV